MKSIIRIAFILCLLSIPTLMIYVILNGYPSMPVTIGILAFSFISMSARLCL